MSGRERVGVHQHTSTQLMTAFRLHAAARGARHSLFPPCARATRAWSSRAARTPLAIAFDIDGVLKQGTIVLPEAMRAIRMLQGENPWHEKVPFIFITNSGGRDEADRAADLSHDFHTPVSPQQVVQAHTVMQSLVPQFGDQPILAVGGPDYPPGASRHVLEGNVYTAHDLHAYAPASFPYAPPDPQLQADVRRVDFSKISFAAIFVFHDSRNWGRDIQYMVDLMRADDSVFGTLLTNEELKARRKMPVYFSHNDLLWGNNFPVPRMGMGAFHTALAAVYSRITNGADWNPIVFGKPEVVTYEHANVLLQRLAATDTAAAPLEPRNVWMVGDNPASDISGANQFGWSSALVRTGVFRDAEGPPACAPTIMADNVEKAIESIMARSWG
ncbi:hypothetical protein MSPP1_001995 [Malassezia sp. CBS 17886]|nr:hypothetical protein MSPP1_001995 [Malassezia sp. CBS 17886]